MENFDRKKHWENIYKTSQPNQVSWYQPVPETSLGFVRQFHLPKIAKIVDIGGGDSLLVDHLLNKGYKDITVLDISKAAIEKTKRRLGNKAKKVKWIVSDVANFKPVEKYDFWHDRATFHFLTHEKDISNYLENA
jgi:trans-aconitate methyltransferase